MAMEFRPPNLTGSADEKVNLTELRRFLFQHIQQLNVALGQLESAIASGGQTQAAAETGTGQIVKKVLAQTSREYLTKSWFNDYFRVGLLGGQQYGVEIGHEESTDGETTFRVAAKLTPGESWLYDGDGNKVLGVVGSTVRIGSYTISTSGGKITIE